MGLFSSIGKAFKSATSFLSPVSDILGIAGSAKGLYDSFTGASLQDQKSLIDYQANAAKDVWKYQKSNSHQLEVDDLRSAGLNPILSAGTASSAHAIAPSGGVSDTRSAQAIARAQQAINLENIKTARTQQALNESASARNAAESKALLDNAQANLENASSNRLRAVADAALSKQRTVNERLYPSNQPTAFKYMNSAKAWLSTPSWPKINSVPRGTVESEAVKAKRKFSGTD